MQLQHKWIDSKIARALKTICDGVSGIFHVFKFYKNIYSFNPITSQVWICTNNLWINTSNRMGEEYFWWRRKHVQPIYSWIFKFLHLMHVQLTQTRFLSYSRIPPYEILILPLFRFQRNKNNNNWWSRELFPWLLLFS